jgi:prenylcysteine alpha-carboxyl methylesterase
MFTGTLDLVLQMVHQMLRIVDAMVFHATVCYKNAKTLFTFLIRGSRTWVIMTLRLVLFTLVLLPGWFQMVRYWLLSPLIIRNLRYGLGAKNRNLLDVYLPVPARVTEKESRKRRHAKSRPKPKPTGAPVVIFVSGGAWTIGYKMWSALVARGLAKLGILCVVPDHRNFPQVSTHPNPTTHTLTCLYNPNP